MLWHAGVDLDVMVRVLARRTTLAGYQDECWKWESVGEGRKKLALRGFQDIESMCS